MARVKGSRQERMIVVPYRPWRTAGLWLGMLVIVLLTGSGAWLYGRHIGVAEGGGALVERDEPREAMLLSNGENAALRLQLLNLGQTADVDKRALASVLQTIVGLREQISQLEEDVLFYKQIMSPENAENGLVIGQLDLAATDSAGTIRYKLELKQQGNNENLIVGYANINVLGFRNEQEVSIPLKDLSTSGQSLDIRLQFRYFQNIEGELMLPADFEPSKVQILAIAEGNNSKTVQKSFGWVVGN